MSSFDQVLISTLLGVKANLMIRFLGRATLWEQHS